MEEIMRIIKGGIVKGKLTGKIGRGLANLAVIGQVEQQKQSQDEQEHALHRRFPISPLRDSP